MLMAVVHIVASITALAYLALYFDRIDLKHLAREIIPLTTHSRDCLCDLQHPQSYFVFIFHLLYGPP